MQGNAHGRRLSSWFRRTLGIGLVAAAILWLLLAFPDVLRDFGQSLDEVRLPFLLLGGCFSLAGTFVGFISFRILFNAASPEQMRFSTLGHLYFSAQLLKHLPGRFFGIGYQILQTRGTISAGTWIAVTALYMALILASGLGLASLILISKVDTLAALAAGLCLTFFLILPLPVSATRFLTGFRSRFPRMGEFVHALLKGFTATSIRTRLQSIGLLLASWAIYLLSWGCYSAAHPSLVAEEGLVIGAFYMFSWAAGFVVLIVPSGLGVREISLTAMMQGFPAPTIIYTMIVGRLSLTLADIILAIAFAPFAPGSTTDAEAPPDTR